MSTELQTILANNPLMIQSGVDEDTAAVAGGSGNQTKRLSIKGGVFRKMVGGKEVGSIEDRHMNVIFVRMAHSASRQCYEGTYEEGKPFRQSAGQTTPLSLTRMLSTLAHQLAMFAQIAPKAQTIPVLARNANYHGAQLSSCHKTRLVMYWNSLSPQLRLSAKRKTDAGLSSRTLGCLPVTTYPKVAW